MKNWKPLNFHIEYENGTEHLVRQDNGYIAQFEMHERIHGGWWARKHNVNNTIRWFDNNTLYGNPISLSSIFTIDENAIRPRHGTSDALPVSISGDWTWDDPEITTSTLEVTSVNPRRRSVTVTAPSSELQRRREQSEVERRRLEEERNRPRRPWDRVRNFFGND